MGSGVMVGMSCHQCHDEGGQESFAAAPGIVHELKEAEIQRQLLLRDTPVRAEPERNRDHVPCMVLTWGVAKIWGSLPALGWSAWPMSHQKGRPDAGRCGWRRGRAKPRRRQRSRCRSARGGKQP